MKWKEHWTESCLTLWAQASDLTFRTLVSSSVRDVHLFVGFCETQLNGFESPSYSRKVSPDVKKLLKEHCVIQELPGPLCCFFLLSVPVRAIQGHTTLKTVPFHRCLSLTSSCLSPVLLTHYILVEKLEERSKQERGHCPVQFKGLRGTGQIGQWSNCRHRTSSWKEAQFSPPQGRESSSIGCIARRLLCLGFCSPHWKFPRPFSFGGGVQFQRAEVKIGDGS